MPSTLNPFASSEIALRFQETYVSEGLNRDVAAIVGPGVFRGFRVTPSATPLNVSLEADSVSTDHSAAIRTANGYALTVKKTGGAFDVNLTTYTNKTVVLAIYGTYAVSSPTSAEIRAYELLPSDEFSGASERPNLIVLGVITVPSSGLIPLANISQKYRNEAWQGESEQLIPPKPLLQNGSFEFGATGSSFKYAAPPWIIATTGGLSPWTVIDSSPGFSDLRDKKSLQLTYASGSGPSSSTAKQWVYAAVRPSSRVRARISTRAVQATTGGSLSLKLNWLDKDGASLSTSTVAIVTTPIESAYKSTDVYVAVPATAYFLESVVIDATSVTATVDAAALRVDDVQVWADTRKPDDVLWDNAVGYLMGKALILQGPGALAATGAAFEAVDGAEPTVIGRRLDDILNDITNAPPHLNWHGRQTLGLGMQDTMKARTTAYFTGTADSGANDLSLINEYRPLTTGPAIRMYANKAGDFVITLNCAIVDGAGSLTWTKDVLSSTASKLELNYSAINGAMVYKRRRDGLSADWLDSSGWGPKWDATIDSRRGQLVTTNYTVDSLSFLDQVLFVDTTAAVTVTLPDPSLWEGRIISIKDITGLATTNNITVAPFGAETIEGVAANKTLVSNWGSWGFIVYNGNWYMI